MARNQLNQQSSLADTLTSQSTTEALTANQGYILDQKIKNLSGQLSASFDASVAQTIIPLSDLGLLKWNTTNNQMTFELTNSAYTNVEHINTTNNTDGSYQTIVEPGAFGITTSTDYYFSQTGSVNPGFGLTGNQPRLQLSANFDSNSSQDILNLKVELMIKKSFGADEGILTATLTKLPPVTLGGTVVALRWEYSGPLTLSNEAQFLGSWGSGEDNNTVKGGGIEMPQSFVPTSYSIDAIGQVTTEDLIFEIYKNGNSTNSTMTLFTGSSSTFNQSVSLQTLIDKGDILNIATPNVDSGGSPLNFTIILLGQFFDTN